MPHYFFDLDDGDSKTRDTEGVVLADGEAARKAAIAILPDLAREELPNGDRRVFVCKVRDETGTILFIATLSLVSEWVNDAGSAVSP
jgi:hypothetical protein